LHDSRTAYSNIVQGSKNAYRTIWNDSKTVVGSGKQAYKKKVNWVGDLDLTPFSNFSVGFGKAGLLMMYTYNGTTEVHAHTDKYNVGIFTSKEGGMFLEENAEFTGTFRCLVDLIYDAHTEKATETGSISVTKMLERAEVSPEASLWYAFVADFLIRNFDRCAKFYGCPDSGQIILLMLCHEIKRSTDGTKNGKLQNFPIN